MRLCKQSGVYPNRFDPEVYNILSQNPPMPEPPIPEYESLKDLEIKLPTDKYVRAYMRRHNLVKDKRMHRYEMADLLGEYISSNNATSSKESNSKNSIKNDMRYQRLLGPAYDFALRQSQVLQENPEMGEDESVELVEKLLEEEDRKERFNAKSKKDEILKKAKSFNEEDQEQSEPSMIFGNPKAAETMAQFGDYLNHVPYHLWTVGAVTALDHWIAIDILQLSEKTWQAILQGDAFSQASDVIAVRSALFPETLNIPDDTDFENDFLDEEAHEEGENRSADQERDAAIDDLLASLGGGDDNMWKEDTVTDKSESSDASYSFDEDEVVAAKLQLAEKEVELWQKKNMQTPFEQWSGSDKNEFEEWLREYALMLPSHKEQGIDQLRKDVLYNFYIPKEESNALWVALSDPTESEIILSQLKQAYETTKSQPKEGESEDEKLQRLEFEAFMNLPFEEQIKQLRELGAMRPLFDETVSSEELSNFIKDNEEVLLEGMEEISITPARDGNIRETDLGLPQKGIRYQLKKMIHGQYESEHTSSRKCLAQERALYKAWGQYRKMKANHEEYLFRQGLLGLEYKNKADSIDSLKSSTQAEKYTNSLPWRW